MNIMIEYIKKTLKYTITEFVSFDVNSYIHFDNSMHSSQYDRTM